MGLLLFACSSGNGKSKTTAGVDGGDDAAVSGPGVRAPVGAHCTGRVDDCADAECRSYGDYSVAAGEGGYGFCSRACQDEGDCPSGFFCAQPGAEKLCLPRCDTNEDCSTWGLGVGWTCASARGNSVCANPAASRGELRFTTQLVVERIDLSGPAQAWRLVPGEWADLRFVLMNRGSSGPPGALIGGSATVYSAGAWMEVESGVGDGAGTWRVRAKPGIPLNEPQQMNIVVPDPIGTGTVEVPFFLRSLSSGLNFTPAVGVSSGSVLGVQGWTTGFGTGPGLRNYAGYSVDDTSPGFPWPYPAGDPWLAEAPTWGSLGDVQPVLAPGNYLGVTIADPSGESWSGQITVVPAISGLAFPPDPVFRSELASGAVAQRYVHLTDPNGTTPVQLSSTQPWLTVTPPSADLWRGDTAFTLNVTEPPEPGSAQAFVAVTWSGTEVGRFRVVVAPDVN